jgi:tetratricopeptide (TPR) repeat protein
MRLLLLARSRAGWLSGAAALALVATLVPAAATANPRSAELRRAGFQYAYNLDHEEALAVFRRAVEADPGDSAAYLAISSVVWLNLLFQRGAITADDYLGSVTEPNVKLNAPPAAILATFRTNAEKALELGEAQLRRNPLDADAHYNVGAALGQLAAFTATVEGSVFGAMKTAHRAFDEQERVLELDPSRKDAGLVVGSYRYAVASLGIFMRWMAHLAGLGGGRERAVRLLEDCAAYPSDAQTEASLVLVLVYNREQRYDDASRLLARLREQYPRNRLLWLESGATDMRAGRPVRALEFLDAGVAMFERDPRAKAFGEAAMWYAKRGAILVALGERSRAEADLRRSLAAEGRGWIHGRAHLELGKLADLAGDRAAANEAYRRGAALCSGDQDPAGAAEANRWIGRPYTGTIAGPGRQ